MDVIIEEYMYYIAFLKLKAYDFSRCLVLRVSDK